MDDNDTENNRIRIHHCSTCNREIIDENYIQCTFCKGFVQCLECFADGYEKDQHVKEHPVILMDPSTPPVFSKDWTIEEELILLNSIALCGIGNWENIANQIKTKNAIECETHYFSTYFETPTAPNPDTSQPPKSPIPLPPPAPFDTRPQESCPSDGHDRNLVLLNKREKTLPAEISGYMPKRHEFEEEFNEESEDLINGIEFTDDIDAKDFERYCKLLELYNSQVTERTIRTKVIEDWKIQYQKFKNLGGYTSKEKEIDAKILALAQFIGKEKTEKLAKSFHDLLRNDEIIESRQQWQKNGIQSHQEGFFLNKLEGYVKDSKVQDSDISKWNKVITEYIQSKSSATTDDEKFLTEREVDFCKSEDIQPPIYSAMKDLFVREYMARGGLTKSEALRMLPEMQKQGDLVYDHLLSVGWISD
ncbi:Transcriptional adapter 2-alpha [Tritrichomonas musculus]|uniref:Transcriptional adapter 2-alpha n=1 Tax=Tritrichomonas musculus TaxID=1915356 RepID=A0ABR2JST8_9EUKA